MLRALSTQASSSLRLMITVRSRHREDATPQRGAAKVHSRWWDSVAPRSAYGASYSLGMWISPMVAGSRGAGTAWVLMT